MKPLARLRHRVAFRTGIVLFGAMIGLGLSSTPAVAENNETAIRPFRVKVPDADVADLKRRLAATRWPDKETVADRSQGAQLEKLQELVPVGDPQMKRQHVTTLIVVTASVLVVSAVLAQSQDRFTLKAANGIAFSEFRGYDAWPLVATSQPDDASGCGTSNVGCMKAILGNPAMIQAYRDGIPVNGQPVPDGAAIAKIEWLKDRDHASPYGVTVPGTQTEMSFMLKDSKRFPDTNGWGYATFAYDAASDTFKPATTNSSFAKGCHGCHTRGVKARDFVYTDYAKR